MNEPCLLVVTLRDKATEFLDPLETLQPNVDHAYSLGVITKRLCIGLPVTVELKFMCDDCGEHHHFVMLLDEETAANIPPGAEILRVPSY